MLDIYNEKNVRECVLTDANNNKVTIYIEQLSDDMPHRYRIFLDPEGDDYDYVTGPNED